MITFDGFIQTNVVIVGMQMSRYIRFSVVQDGYLEGSGPCYIKLTTDGYFAINIISIATSLRQQPIKSRFPMGVTINGKVTINAHFCLCNGALKC